MEALTLSMEKKLIMVVRTTGYKNITRNTIKAGNVKQTIIVLFFFTEHPSYSYSIPLKNSIIIFKKHGGSV